MYAPPTEELEALLSTDGPFSFYESVAKRQACCHVRKVIPLKRVLGTAEVWVTGLRREHSANRGHVALFEYDEVNNLYKVNPLAEWTQEQVEAYINTQGLPINPLHAKGFPSIGCQPCTRAVAEGADPRSGRWWWEDAAHNECGLHKR